MAENQEIELRSEEVQEILTRVPHWMIRWGNIIILLIVLMVFLFSYIIKYPDIITTQIIITTKNPPEKLLARSTGKISKILVKDRSLIEAKTALAVINNTADYGDIFELMNCIDTIEVNKPQFNFPISTFSSRQLGEIQNAFTIFEKEYTSYDLNRDLNPYSVEKNAQRLELSQLQQRLSLMQEQYEISQNEIKLKNIELERYKLLYQKGIIAPQEWESKNLEFLQSEKSLRNISAQTSQLKSSINELNRNSGNTKINESKDNTNLLISVLQSLSQLKKAIRDWELAYVLRSSISGQVSFMQIWTENQSISAGEEVFTIVPLKNVNFVGKVRALANNSGKIKIGQDVNIRLANFPDREFGIIKGKVEKISLTPDSDGNLLIDISLPNGIKTSYDKEITFQQEMSGTADIVTEDLRLLERVLYQFRDIFSR